MLKDFLQKEKEGGGREGGREEGGMVGRNKEKLSRLFNYLNYLVNFLFKSF